MKSAQVRVQTQKEAGGKGAMQIFVVIQSVKVWKVFKHGRKLHVSPYVDGLAVTLFARLILKHIIANLYKFTHNTLTFFDT